MKILLVERHDLTTGEPKTVKREPVEREKNGNK